MKIVATVALSNFPMWKMCMESLHKQVDAIYVRVDMTKENKLQELLDSGLATRVLQSHVEWNRWNWRNEMAQMVEEAGGADLVLVPDQDEVYDDNIGQDCINFLSSGKDMMMFNYFAPMPTDDGRIIPELKGRPYPSLAHCSGHRWMPGITFEPYCGLAQPTNYANKPNNQYMAKTLIKHYCMYTKEMEEEKKKWVMKEYGVF